jgi:hypothetical protein
MVTLAKQPDASFFAMNGMAANGVAFLPETDDDASTITLDEGKNPHGFFLTWSGGAPTAADFARFDSALRDARAAATSTSRVALQCFRTGEEDPIRSLTAKGADPAISETRLPLSDKLYARIDAAFKLEITDCRVIVRGDSLVFVPVADHLKHRLINAGTVIALADLAMPLDGPLSGTFQSTCSATPDDLVKNHFAMEYSTLGAETDDGTGADPYFEIDSDERLPLIGSGQAGDGSLDIDASFDVVHGLDQNRTYLRLSKAVPLHSGFRTTHGHKVLLTPIAPHDGGPVAGFSYVMRRYREITNGETAYDRVNLLLEGDFEVSLANEDNSPAQMPTSGFGIVISDSQHEYLQVPGNTNAGSVIMSFQRGAGHIGEGDTQQLAADDDDTLTATDNHDLTSWARVTRQGFHQPIVSEARDVRRLDRSMALVASDSALTHNPFSLQRRSSTSLLKPDGFVPALPRAPVKAKAFAAAAEVGKPSIASRLAAERRKLLDVKSTTFAAFEAPAAKTTPIGFEIEETSAGVTKITVARTLGPNDEGQAELIITSATEGAAIAPRFVNDIVRNQLFMVANTSAGPGSTDAIKLEGILTLSKWGFNIQLPIASTFKAAAEDSKQQSLPPPPLVIIKGFEGQSIKDLIQKEQLWSGFGYLYSPEALTPVAFAKKQFADAVEQATDAKDPIYAPFLQAIDDPKWTGVLVLSVKLAPAVLPDQVRGLLGGIDLNRLRAHHFAIPVRRLTATGEGALSKPFAAVDYRAAEDKEDGDKDKKEGKDKDSEESGEFEGPGQAPNGSDEELGMKVTVLKVGFNNGAIQSFACKLDLKVGAFFHDTEIKLFKPNGDIATDKKIELEGRWSRRIVDGQTLETYDFFTESAFEVKMGDEFPLLEKAKISRIGYVAETAGADKELVTSKFIINGDMDFKELENFDFLDVKTTKFTGLSIDLRFKIKGDLVTLPKFRFSPGALEFDFDASELKNKARGFFGSLPLKFKGFGWLGGTFDLPDLGYFSLGKGTGGKAPFMLKFDLDLGSLGSFASALSKFKMELGFSFGIDAQNGFNWNLGMRFAGSGGKDLDIGLQGFLQLTCERYEVVELKQSNGEVYYGFRGVNARLIVFEQPLPPEKDNVNVFIFLDPAKLGQSEGLGWLMAYSSEPSGDIIDVRKLVLGQRVEALKTLPAGKVTTRSLVRALGALAEKPGVQPDPDKPYKIPEVTFAPDRDWTIGFHAMIYRFIELGFAVRDPDLAGLLLDVKLEEGSSQSLFSVDILYRKLTEDLGVYAAEIVLPPELRNWQFGAAGITLPVIGVEIYTDGNWGIDLGYPANKDFSRSFAMSIFPFVGAGGLYYRRVSGPAATLLPAKVFHDEPIVGDVPANLVYDPVTEFGMGFRVGLGVVLAQGILNAGLSLTVYGYLEGAFGRLQNPRHLPTHARKTYIVVAGAVGVMGELYGYVDFGIVKAGVFVQLYVEVGFRLETDRAIVLYYEVGVSVRVRVVIARIRVFGRGIEIAISFSFKTKVRFSQSIGHDQNPEYYGRGSGFLPSAVATPSKLEAPDWEKMPSPAQWADTLTSKVPLEVAIQPDITIAPDASGEAELHAVFLMSAEFGRDRSVVTPAERLVQGLTAWALCAHMNIAPAALRDTAADQQLLQELSVRLAARNSAMPIADYATIRKFLTQAFEGSAREPVELSATPDVAPAGMILPMPETMVIQRYLSEHHVEAIRLTDYSFVDAAYREQLEAAFKRFLIEQDQAQAKTFAALAETRQSLTAVLFEEWVLMIMRSGIDQLRRVVETKSLATLGAALDEFVAAFDAGDGRQLRSSAAETGAMVSRFFTYGQRIPMPDGADGNHVPDSQEKPDHTDDPKEPFFHAMLRLAGQQMPIGNVRSLRIPAMTYDDWLVVPTRMDFDLRDGADAPKVLEEARTLNLGGDLKSGKLYRLRRRYVALGSRATASKIKDTSRTLWSYSKEARALAARDLGLAPTYYKADAAGGQGANGFKDILADEAAHLQPAIVIDVSLRRPDDSTEGVKVTDAFEIKGIGEPLRALIDPFAPVSDGGIADLPAIDWIKICKIGADGETLVPVGIDKDHKATLIQTNLSVEARPETMMIAAVERNRIDPVADTDAPLAFIRLLRQAAIVNTGGYHLAYPGASSELADLFTETSTPNALDAGGRLRVVIALKDTDTATAHPFSNALLVAAEYDVGTVIAVRDDDTADPMHEPGILPIEADRPRKIVGATDLQIELAGRFSNLALEVEVRDDAGQLLGTQFRDQAFPIGPDMDDAENEPGYVEILDEDGEPTHYRYRASVPVANIAGIARDNVYSLVGGKVTIRGVWRDIYGNNWPGHFGEQQIDLVYSDRLLGLTGLPYIKAAYWPVGERKIAIALTSDYAASLELDGSTADPTEAPADEWVQSAHDDIDRSVALLKRAVVQLNDKHVTVAARSALGTDGAMNKARIVGHIETASGNLGALKSLIIKGMTRKDMREAITAWLVDRRHETKEEISFSPDKIENFSEMNLAVIVQRPDPAVYPDLYDRELRKQAADEVNQDALASGTSARPSRRHRELVDDVSRTIEIVSPNISTITAGATLLTDDKDPLPGGDTADYMAALAITAADHRIAVGYSDTAGVTEKATWLIARSYLKDISDGSLFTTAKHLALGLPPLETEAYSQSLTDLKAPDNTTFSREIRDADADAYGREALMRIERLLSPAVSVKLLNAATPMQQTEVREAIDTMLRVKEGLAERLAARLEPVFAADAAVLQHYAAERGRRPKDALADLLKRDLRNHYKLTSLLLYLDPSIDGIPAMTRAAQGVVKVGEAKMRATNYSMPLALDDNVTSRDLVIFCEALPDPVSANGIAPSLPLPLSFDLTHVQKWPRYDISTSEVSYRKAAWLKLYDDTPAGEKSWLSLGLPQDGLVPNPLRRLPEMPSLDREFFETDDYVDDKANPAENLKNARQWRSIRDFRWEGEPQDRLTVEVQYGTRGQVGSFMARDNPTPALVKFVLESDRVMLAIENGGIAEYVWLAKRAKEIFGQQPAFAGSLTDPGTAKLDRVTLREVALGSGLGVQATGIKLFGDAAVPRKFAYRAAVGTGFGDAVEFTRDSTGDPKPLPAAGDKPGVRKLRRLETNDLDILDAASARTTLGLTRNEDIAGKPLQESFIYRLPTIASGQDIVPSLDRGGTVSVGKFNPDKPGSVEDALSVFLAGLLGKDGAPVSGYTTDLIFEYEPVPFTEDGSSGVVEMGGPIIAIRTGFDPTEDGVTRLATEIHNWFQTESPARNDGLPIGSTIIDARVFVSGGAGDTDQRVLRLSRCQLDFDKS